MRATLLSSQRTSMTLTRGTSFIARLTLCVGLTLATAAVPATAQQVLPSVTEQPAATLLVPYFEVDLQHPAGANTLFTVNNASASATMAQVTIWSALHVPVHSFSVYLTGFDMQTFDVRALINGERPATASDGQDPLDVISNQGPASQDINFASCNGLLPLAALPQTTIDHIRASLTGAASPLTGQCASISDGTQVARGYITVDVSNQCSDANPSQPGYFVSGGNGVAGNRNILWGDVTYTNFMGGTESSDGGPLVHIRADAADTELSTPGHYTFYGRYVGWTAADNREPLATTFGARFSLGGAFPQTSLTAWRDNKSPQGYFACGATPGWYPLSQDQIVVFNEEEVYESVPQIPFAPPGLDNSGTLVPFPAGAQRVRLGSAAFPTTFTFGWLYLNLNTTVTGQTAGLSDPTASQAWVSVHMKGTGRYSIGWAATMFDSARERNFTTLPTY